ncbi:MAG: DUF523 domain-containing protein [Rubrivivax sp.]
MSTPRAPVLVSACLLGAPVRHDGGHRRDDHAVLQRWRAEGRVLALCPERLGGLPTPRPPAEITAGAGGLAVWQGQARVLTQRGDDVSPAFVAGAAQVLAAVKAQGVRVAVLKAGSPSCGPHDTHDGRFVGQRVAQPGVTAAVLRAWGVVVFDEHQWAEAAWADESLSGSADGACRVEDPAAPWAPGSVSGRPLSP